MAQATQAQHPDQQHDAVVANALNAIKLWWLTPIGATGEDARLDAAVVALKRLRDLPPPFAQL